jgi:hypothetical protein
VDDDNDDLPYVDDVDGVDTMGMGRQKKEKPNTSDSSLKGRAVNGTDLKPGAC